MESVSLTRMTYVLTSILRHWHVRKKNYGTKNVSEASIDKATVCNWKMNRMGAWSKYCGIENERINNAWARKTYSDRN